MLLFHLRWRPRRSPRPRKNLPLLLFFMMSCLSFLGIYLLFPIFHMPSLSNDHIYYFCCKSYYSKWCKECESLPAVSKKTTADLTCNSVHCSQVEAILPTVGNIRKVNSKFYQHNHKWGSWEKLLNSWSHNGGRCKKEKKKKKKKKRGNWKSLREWSEKQTSWLVGNQEQNEDCSATMPSGGTEIGCIHFECVWFSKSPRTNKLIEGIRFALIATNIYYTVYSLKKNKKKELAMKSNISLLLLHLSVFVHTEHRINVCNHQQLFTCTDNHNLAGHCTYHQLLLVISLMVGRKCSTCDKGLIMQVSYSKSHCTAPL